MKKRKEHNQTPVIRSGILYTDDEHTGLRVGSAGWFDWLELGRTFYLDEPGVTFRCETRRNGRFWYAYKRCDGKLRKKYAGRSEVLTLEYLATVASRVIEA